jgi:hypothetical protein
MFDGDGVCDPNYERMVSSLDIAISELMYLRDLTVMHKGETHERSKSERLHLQSGPGAS